MKHEVAANRAMLWGILLSFLPVSSLSCSTVRIPDFRAYITLPASGDGYWVQTVSNKEGRVPKAEWDEKKKRGIVLLSEDWQKLRSTVVRNCLSNDCKDTVGAFDELFQTLDTTVPLIPLSNSVSLIPPNN